MAGTRDARQRILDAAGELVTMGGVAAATPAAIAERAGAGKMSLYRHFSGKDELVADALAQRDLDYRSWLIGDPADGTAGERLLALFDRAAARADQLGTSFIGCPYVNARLGLPDDDHPPAPVVVSHKDGMLRELAGLFTERGLPHPAHRAPAALILLHGAVAHSAIPAQSHPPPAPRRAPPPP